MPILAIDQGTTGTTALALDHDGRTLGRATRDFAQHFPEPGQVEHDADEIWATVEASVAEALRAAGLPGDRIEAIGITNQRETSVLWSRETGKPIARAVVWQDRRTTPVCERLRAEGKEARVRERTGLVLDPYFSGTKMKVLLDEARHPEVDALLGTIDSFLIHRLSGGEAHVTDTTNASRTLLMNLRTLAWDDEMLSLFGVPRAALPRIVPSAGIVARTRGFAPLPDGVPVAGVAGDQQAALFGQACFREGELKCTYGTGAFLLVNTGSAPRTSRAGLLSTVAWTIGDEVTYALEGATFVAGAAVQWLRDGLGLIARASDVEALARKVPSSEGVTFVPALAGLGAPHWDPRARGLVSGITRGTTAAHLARATLDGIALSVADLVRAMGDDLGAPVTRMKVDGGAAVNDLLMQIQADVTGIAVERPAELESTARGAAMLAGLGAGIFAKPGDAARLVKLDRTFSPELTPMARQAELDRWAAAIARARA